jgi:hypothetical protein
VDGYAGDWSVHAQGICSNGVTGHELVLAFAGLPANQQSAATTVSCPPGKMVIGAAGTIPNGPGDGAAGLDVVSPDTGLTSVSVAGSRVENPAPVAEDVAAEAVCIDPVPGAQRVSVLSSYDSATSKSVAGKCPAGTVVHSVGAALFGAAGQVGITRMALSSRTAFSAEGIEDGTGFAGNWRITAIAICAP